MKRLQRIVGALVIVAAIGLLGTLHTVGYREAFARVEDYVQSFGPGVPSAIEPYGVNRLLRTTRVRYNDAQYQLSFSTTMASPEDVVHSYAAALGGAKLVESSPDEKTQTLYHYDGTSVTAVRAMPLGAGQAGTLVQKLHAVKKPTSRQQPTDALRELPSADALMSIAEDPSLPREEKQRRALALLAGSVNASLQHHGEQAASRRVQRDDRPGFDLPGIPRYPGARRLSSMALEDGRMQVVQYQTDSPAGDVAHFFVSNLPADGWQIDPVSAGVFESNRGSSEQHLLCRKGRAELNILVTSPEGSGSTAVTLMVQ